MKRLISLFLALAMVLSVTPVFAETYTMKEGYEANLNGEDLGMFFLEKNGVMLMPMRYMAECLDYTVTWDGDARCAVATDGANRIEVPIGKAWAERNGLKSSLPTENILFMGATYMPVEALKAFNASYKWDGAVLYIDASTLDGKYVKITQNGKALTPEGGSKADSAKIVMEEISDSDAQIWKFTSRGEGAYRLENKATLRAIDVPGDSKDAGKALIQYGLTGGGNQNYVPVRFVSDGEYFIKCFNSSLYMTVGEDGVVTQEEFDKNKENQKFTFEVVGAAGVSADDDIAQDTLKDEYDGKYVVLDNEICRLVLTGERYLAVNKATGETKEVDKAEFVLAKITPDMYEAANELGGKYVKVTVGDESLTTENANTENGSKIVLSKDDTDSAVWAFVSLGGGQYTLLNKKAGSAIDVPNESKEAGIALSLYTSNNKNHQRYTLEDAEGGKRLKNVNSGMYLTIKDGVAYQEEKADNGQIFGFEVVGESNIKLMGATATSFVLKGEGDVTNVKLQWSWVDGADCYDVYKKTDDGDFEFLTSTQGFSVDDYDLEIGKTYTYGVYAIKGNLLIEYAETKAFTPYEMPVDMKSSSNLEPSGFSTPGGGMRDKDGVYYRFSQSGRKDGGKGFGQVTMQTSTDNVTYTDPVVIMTVEDILAHETCKDIEDIRFESVNFKYNPKANNFGFIAHAEKGSGGYDFARISVATYTPGDEKMVFHGAVRPNGDDVRDLNTFIDDDGTGYIMGATHNNADLSIYRLKDDWSGIEKRVALINQGKWRELPNVLKVDGIYYLFTSGCAGWYPTPGCYNSAKSMEGPWSDLRNAGNQTTFSSQSGYGFFLKNGSENYMMNSYRWMNYWKDATLKTTQSLRFPITVSDGYAFYDYFEELLYSWDEDRLAPVQRGRNLSQNRPSREAGTGEWILNSKVNDADYNSLWTTETKWPYAWEVDLGQEYTVNQAQISWKINNGSEAYYNYVIEGSSDGVNYTVICDRSEGYTDYGFTVDNFNAKARFVRVTVNDAKPRSGSNNYPSSFYEVKIFGR